MIPFFARIFRMFARDEAFFERVCRSADLVLPVSRYLERFLVDSFGLDPSRSVVVGNGVDDGFFAAGAVPGPVHERTVTGPCRCGRSPGSPGRR